MESLRIFEREDLTPVRKLLMMKAIAGGAAISEYTETGNPVEFNTNIAKALGIVAAFSLVQAGSGDPSPDNVRPITGFSGADVYLSATGADDPAKQTFAVTFPAFGKNLIHSTPYRGQLFNVQAGTDLAQTWTRASSEENGNTITVTVTHQWYGVVYSTDMLPPGTYNIHIEPGDVHCRVSAYVADKDFIALSRYALTTNNKAITLTETARIVVTISNDNSELGSVTLTRLQVESGNSYTAWEAYNSTAYGGTLDLSTGVLTVDYGYIASYNGETIPGEWISDRDVYAEGTTPTTGAEVAYVLATPLVYQLSTVKILSLIGDNVLWSDLNGDLTVKYKKKG